MSQVSLGRPEFVPGTPPGHSDRQIPLCDFSLSVFFLSIVSSVTSPGGEVVIPQSLLLRDFGERKDPDLERPNLLK